MVETKTIDVNVPAFTPVTRWRFQLSNHLGSASLEVSEAAAVISYEEYHPFGTTAYRSSNGDVEVSAKRYRYTGKERDEETGFGYHGARYLALWLGRWGSADPSGLVDGANLFAYVRGNPVGLSDPSGREGTSAPSFHQAFLSHELSRFDISKAAVDRLLGRVPEPSEDGKKPWLYDVRVHPTTQVIGGALMGAIRAEVPLLAPFHPPLSHEAADAERKTELLFGALKLQDAFANTPKGPPPGTFPGLLTPEGATALTRVAELPPGSVGALVAVGHSGAQLLSTGGGASRPTEPPQAREDAPANQTEKPAPALPPKKTATQWRNTPGTATGAGFKVRPDRPWLVQGRAGHVPESVAARLAGRTFKNFDEYRAAFWRAVGEDPDLMRQFGRSNQAHILKGEAPYAATSQQIGDQPQYEVFNLHHKKSIESGGAVYDAENILVASPLQHYRGLH
jgi:RHS repeat-associated protein